MAVADAGVPADELARQFIAVGREEVAGAQGEGEAVCLAMQDLGARIRVVAIARGGDGDLEYPPRRDTRLAAGDRAYLLGPYEELLRVLGRERTGAAA